MHFFFSKITTCRFRRIHGAVGQGHYVACVSVGRVLTYPAHPFTPLRGDSLRLLITKSNKEKEQRDDPEMANFSFCVEALFCLRALVIFFFQSCNRTGTAPGPNTNRNSGKKQ